MHNRISWTERMPDGVKREVRVQVSQRHLKWQFKRADEEKWDYESLPGPADWDMLEDILKRRAGRGSSVKMLVAIRELRTKAGR